MATESRRHWQRYDAATRRKRQLGVLALVVVAGGFFFTMSIQTQYILDAHVHIFDLFSRMFPPDTSILPSLIGPTIETFHMSVLATLLAGALSVPLALLAAENTSPNRIVWSVSRTFIALARSVHDIIWALVFILLLGPGALAGMLGIAFKSVGFIGKFFAEEIEEIDPRKVEAIRATGAPPLHVLVYSIVPQIKAAFVGLTIYRWDVNVRAGTIVGLVGAGGIGMELDRATGRLLWKEVSMILIVIFGLVIMSEIVSAYLREKVR